MKNKETLKEFAEKKYGTSIYDFDQIDAFIEGANYNINALDFEIAALKSLIQDMDATIKSKYSDEEVIQLLKKFNQEIQEVEDVREWFEQFKKKKI